MNDPLMEITVVWKDQNRADTTWYCVEETTFLPEKGPYQLLKVKFKDLGDDSGIHIIFVSADEISAVYYKKMKNYDDD